MEGKLSARIYTNDFNRLVAATKDFMSPASSNRTECKYIRLDFNAEEQCVTACAVDGYRLSVEHAVISYCEKDFTVYIKSNVKLPNKKYAVIELLNNEVVIRCDDFSFGYTQPNISNPFNWEGVIPASRAQYKIAFNGQYMLEALQAAKISCGNAFNGPVVLEFRGRTEPILLRTNKKDIKMVLPIRMQEE